MLDLFLAVAIVVITWFAGGSFTSLLAEIPVLLFNLYLVAVTRSYRIQLLSDAASSASSFGSAHAAAAATAADAGAFDADDEEDGQGLAGAAGARKTSSKPVGPSSVVIHEEDNLDDDD